MSDEWRGERRAFTLVEMFVVMFIILGLLALLLPAVQHAREKSRRAVCQNNLKQLALAMAHYGQLNDQWPFPSPGDRIGGWTVAIMPFMEMQQWADEFTRNTTLAPATRSPLAEQRPRILSCPSAPLRISKLSPVLVGDYTLTRSASQAAGSLSDVPSVFHTAWVLSPETLSDDAHVLKGPHTTGFNVAHLDGWVEFEPHRPR